MLIGLVLVLAAYFAVMVLIAWNPAAVPSPVLFTYLLSLVVAGLVLAILFLLGVIGCWLDRRRDRDPGPFHHLYRSALTLSCAGFLFFGVSLLAQRLVLRGLPAGSFLQAFDATAWQHKDAADFVEDGITSRQRMLGDVVRAVLPNRSRTELETLLGPSRDSGYFASTGRDLIYELGPQRNSLFQIDQEWLLIWLDADGRFARYEVRTD